MAEYIAKGDHRFHNLDKCHTFFFFMCRSLRYSENHFCKCAAIYNISTSESSYLRTTSWWARYLLNQNKWTCSHLFHGDSKAKPDRGINAVMSREIWLRLQLVVAIGVTEGNLQNHTSYIYIYWNTVKGRQTASTHRKTIVAWLLHKAVKSYPYIQFTTIYSTTLPYSSIKLWSEVLNVSTFV